MNNQVSKIETSIFWFFIPQVFLAIFAIFCKLLSYVFSISTNPGTSLVYATAKIFDIALDIRSGINKIIFQTLFDSWAVPLEILIYIAVLIFCANYLRKILF